MTTQSPYVRWFSDLRLSDVPAVGGKNASLGKRYSELAREGIRVPDGFALTAAGAWGPLRALLTGFDPHDLAALGSYGLGENIVQGKVDPDGFYVHKPTFRQGHRAALSRALGGKEMRLVFAGGRGAATTRNRPTPLAARRHFCLPDAEVLELADYAIRIEDHARRLSSGRAQRGPVGAAPG